MTLSATGTSYSASRLQAFVTQAQQQGRLSATEAARLKAGGENISLQQLEASCQGHPQLEKVVQAFVQTQDRLSASTPQSYDFSQGQASFAQATATAASTDPLVPIDDRIQRLSKEINRLQGRFSDSLRPSQISEIKRQIGQYRAERQSLTQKREQLVRAGGIALVDQLHAGQSLSPDGNSGLDVVLRNTAEADAGLGETLSTGTASTPLDLKTGQGLTYANLIVAQGPELHGLLHVLNGYRNHSLAQPPAEQDLATLKSFGLYLKDGQLVNPLTREAVGSDELTKIMQTAIKLEAVQQPGAVSTPEAKALHMLRHTTAAALKASEALTSARARLDQSIAGLAAANQDLKARTDTLDTDSSTLSTEITGLDDTRRQAVALASAVDYLGDPNLFIDAETGLAVSRRPDDLPEPSVAAADLPPVAPPPASPPVADTPAAEVPAVVRPAAPGRRFDPARLASTNAALAPYGMQIVATGGRFSFTIGGREVDRQTFFHQARMHLRDKTDEVGSGITRVRTLSAQVEQDRQDVLAAQARVTSAEAEMRTADGEHRRALEDCETRLSELEAASADPQLPPEARAASAALITQLRAQVARSREDLPRLQARMASLEQQSRQLQARADTSLTRAAHVRQAAAAELEAANQALDQLGEALTKSSLLDALAAFGRNLGEALGSDALRTLLEQASNRIDHLLVRLRQDETHSAEQLTSLNDDLKKCLGDLNTQFASIEHSQASRSQLAQQLTSDHLLRLRQSSHYHLNKLQELQQLSHDRQSQELAASLHQLQGQLFVARSASAAP